jgi:hypothetical protein
MKKILLIGLFLFISFTLVLGQDSISIGKIGEEGELVYPTQAEEGPDGNIYVYDMVDAYIKVYSPEGKFLRKFGGEGQGPGEIKRAEGVRFGFTVDGKLYFTEFINGHRWITLMELSGVLYKTIKLQISEVFGISRSYPLKDGGFLVQLAFFSETEVKDDYFLYKSPRELVCIDSEGKIVSRLKKTRYVTRISYRSDGADSPVPFAPQFMWCAFEKGSVLFSEGLGPILQVYDYEGNLLKEIKSPLPEPGKVTKNDLDQWRKRRKEQARDKEWYQRFGTVIEKYKKSIHEFKPNLDGIFLTPEGNILVAGEAQEGIEDVDYWLLDKMGKILVGIAHHTEFLILRDQRRGWRVPVLCPKKVRFRGARFKIFLEVKNIICERSPIISRLFLPNETCLFSV